MICNHLCGLAQSRIVNPKTDETIVSWLNPFRAVDAGKVWTDWKGGYKFKYCPECGQNITALKAGEIVDFGMNIEMKDCWVENTSIGHVEIKDGPQ